MNDVLMQIKALLNSFSVPWAQHLGHGFTMKYVTFFGLKYAHVGTTRMLQLMIVYFLGNKTSQAQEPRTLFSSPSFIKSSDVTRM